MRRYVAGFIIGAVAAVSILMFAGIRVDARADELESWYAYIEVVCEQKDICPEFVQALIEQESNWKPDARNGDCVGLMQISERWHVDRMERLGAEKLTDPYDNILTGVDYLYELFCRYEDPAMVLMLYNGDSRAWNYWETGEMSEYARKILERAEELERRKNGIKENYTGAGLYGTPGRKESLCDTRSGSFHHADGLADRKSCR